MSNNIQVANQAIRFDHIPDKELMNDAERINKERSISNNDRELAEMLLRELTYRKINNYGLHL